MKSIPPISAALLIHDEPELAAILCQKLLRAGAARVVFFDGSGRGEVAVKTLALLPPAYSEGVAFSGWSQALGWGNLLPFSVAALRFAHSAGIENLMMVDSDLVPVRADAFEILGRTLHKLESMHEGVPIVLTAWVARVNAGQGYLKAGENYPARKFMESAIAGRNPLAKYLVGWSGTWATGTFNPGTVFNSAAIEAAVKFLAPISRNRYSDIDPKVVFAPEETFIQTALDISGCVFHSPNGMRGIRWRPAIGAHEKIASDALFVHPVPRLAAHPLWQTPFPHAKISTR